MFYLEEPSLLQNHRTELANCRIHVVKGYRRSPVWPPPQSRTILEIRWRCSGLFPVPPWKALRLETAQFPWATYPTAWHPRGKKVSPHIHSNPLIICCRTAMHCCEGPDSVSSAPLPSCRHRGMLLCPFPSMNQFCSHSLSLQGQGSLPWPHPVYSGLSWTGSLKTEHLLPCRGSRFPGQCFSFVLVDYAIDPAGPFLQTGWASLGGSPALQDIHWHPGLVSPVDIMG